MVFLLLMLKELLKLSVADIHPKKDLPHVIDQFTKQAQGKITLAKDIPVLRKDKKVVYCDINSKVIEIGKKEYLVGFFRDITERKKAEEALKESEKKWRSFLDNAPDIVIIVDRKGKIEYINYVQPGFSLEKVIGTNIYDYVPPEHHAKMRASISKVFRTGKPDSYEVVGPGPKGMTLYYLTAVGPIKENEQVVAVILFSRDITERKRVEEKLKFLKEFNERVVNSISDALLVIDPYNYTIISANEAALKQSKLRKKELVGKPCYEITHHRSKPCKPPHDICPIQEMLKTGKAITIEHTHFDKYNNEIYVEVSVSPVRNKEGKIIQVVHIAKDITERKKAEEALKESEEKFRKLFESANDGIIYLSRFGRILDVNEKTVQLFGGSKKELLGKDFTKVGIFSLRDIPKLMSNFSKVLAGKKTILNIQIKNKRGQEIPLECSSSLIKKDDKVVGMMVIMRDITERKKTEEELKKRTEELEKFSKFAVGRELRMIELKKEINELREKLRERSKYNVKIKKR